MKLGEYDFDQAGETGDQTFRVANMRLHRQYDTTTYENDIAVIKLDRAATLTNSVWPICMPPRRETFTNRRAFVIGWGTIYFGGPTSSTLQEVIVVNLNYLENQTKKRCYPGERARVGKHRVRHQLRQVGPAGSGHHAVRGRDEPGLLSGQLSSNQNHMPSNQNTDGRNAGRLRRAAQLHEPKYAALGAMRGGQLGRAVCRARYASQCCSSVVYWLLQTFPACTPGSPSISTG